MLTARNLDGLAPAVGLEPTTKRLTAARSTTELRRSEVRRVSSDVEAAGVTGAGSAPGDRIARLAAASGSAQAPELEPGDDLGDAQDDQPDAADEGQGDRR